MNLVKTLFLFIKGPQSLTIINCSMIATISTGHAMIKYFKTGYNSLLDFSFVSKA